MITASQAEELAQSTMQEYIAKCGCENVTDVANALMKLVSMCGLGMCATVGQPEAVERLQGTTNYIAKAEAGRHWNMERAN